MHKEPLKFVEYLSERKDGEHLLAKDLLESGKLTTDANQFLREHLERYAFKRYYGMVASAEMRSALLTFHAKHQRKVSLAQIRRAYPNIQLVGSSQITAKLDRFDHVSRWMVTGLCWLTALYAIFVMVTAALSMQSSSRMQFLTITIASLVLLFIAVMFSTLNWPYHNTRTIINLAKSSE